MNEVRHYPGFHICSDGHWAKGVAITEPDERFALTVPIRLAGQNIVQSVPCGCLLESATVNRDNGRVISVEYPKPFVPMLAPTKAEIRAGRDTAERLVPIPTRPDPGMPERRSRPRRGPDPGIQDRRLPTYAELRRESWHPPQKRWEWIVALCLLVVPVLVVLALAIYTWVA